MGRGQEPYVVKAPDPFRAGLLNHAKICPHVRTRNHAAHHYGGLPAARHETRPTRTAPSASEAQKRCHSETSVATGHQLRNHLSPQWLRRGCGLSVQEMMFPRNATASESFRNGRIQMGGDARKRLSDNDLRPATRFIAKRVIQWHNRCSYWFNWLVL